MADVCVMSVVTVVFVKVDGVTGMCRISDDVTGMCVMCNGNWDVCCIAWCCA